MQCPRCMNEVADTTKFCTKCAFNIQAYRANVLGEAVVDDVSPDGSAAAITNAPAAAPKRSFIADALSYPLTGSGPYIIVGGVLMLLVGSLFLLIYFFMYGYLALYYLNIIKSTTNKKDQPPDWPELNDIFEVLKALIMFVENLLFAAALPMIVYYFIAPEAGSRLYFYVMIGACVWFCIYLPMATIVAAQTNNIIALNPVTVSMFLLKAPPKYYLVCLLYFLAAIPYIIVSNLYSSAHGFIIFDIAMYFFFLYTMLVTARMLGLFCKEILPD